MTWALVARAQRARAAKTAQAAQSEPGLKPPRIAHDTRGKPHPACPLRTLPLRKRISLADGLMATRARTQVDTTWGHQVPVVCRRGCSHTCPSTATLENHYLLNGWRAPSPANMAGRPTRKSLCCNIAATTRLARMPWTGGDAVQEQEQHAQTAASMGPHPTAIRSIAQSSLPLLSPLLPHSRLRSRRRDRARLRRRSALRVRALLAARWRRK